MHLQRILTLNHVDVGDVPNFDLSIEALRGTCSYDSKIRYGFGWMFPSTNSVFAAPRHKLKRKVSAS